LFQPEDFAALYAIEEVCFRPPHQFSRTYMRRLIRQPHAATWIAEEGEKMVGFGLVEWTQNEVGVLAYVQTLEVLPEVRGRGVGGELLGRLEGSVREADASFIWLHVDAENVSAIRVYEKHAYQAQGTEQDYYGPGRAAVIYAKTITLPPRSKVE
jgi:ribosomal-protein-alanine N-acetyltransferase